MAGGSQKMSPVLETTALQEHTYYTDELRQRHLDGDGDLLALVDGRADQLVVALGTQQEVHQTLLGILGPAA
ncbi:hypothetical protein EYF80_012649 [Liparis tanakae]|uniref:Uncharacterized protein n=1 Tax=Liparis tanakae TaxID=230148 RepID=A0A4Z2IGV1_9TELE|nr:hypothetical protein EYF80_012649 [Liparis tanakae]